MPGYFRRTQADSTCTLRQQQDSEGTLVSDTILVVDDDDPVRVMLARLLETRGYTLLQASSAMEAQAQCDTQRPDLVISDIVMPGASGIDLRRELSERWPTLPVILISGFSSEGPAEFAAGTPYTQFLQKPFAAERLLEIVAEALENVNGSEDSA